MLPGTSQKKSLLKSHSACRLSRSKWSSGHLGSWWLGGKKKDHSTTLYHTNLFLSPINSKTVWIPNLKLLFTVNQRQLGGQSWLASQILINKEILNICLFGIVPIWCTPWGQQKTGWKLKYLAKAQNCWSCLFKYLLCFWTKVTSGEENKLLWGK